MSYLSFSSAMASPSFETGPPSALRPQSAQALTPWLLWRTRMGESEWGESVCVVEGECEWGERLGWDTKAHRGSKLCAITCMPSPPTTSSEHRPPQHGNQRSRVETRDGRLVLKQLPAFPLIWGKVHMCVWGQTKGM